MADFEIIIGNRNYSSWSLRPWLLLEYLEIEHDETLIPLDQPDTKARLEEHSPSGLVPVLRHGKLRITESLAICEYLAELFPAGLLWPDNRTERALARAVSHEMHGGFLALRTHMPMNIKASHPGKGRGEGVEANIARITGLWNECLGRGSQPGDFLFGPFGIADAMYAPVVTRFKTYAVELDDTCQKYADAILDFPAMQKWAEAALEEPWTLEASEI